MWSLDRVGSAIYKTKVRFSLPKNVKIFPAMSFQGM